MADVAKRTPPIREDIQGVSVTAESSRRAYLTRGPSGFGFLFSTSTRSAAHGVNHFISGVDPDSPAATAGFIVGDRILQINGATVIGLPHTDVIRILQESPSGRPIQLLLSSPRQRYTAPPSLPGSPGQPSPPGTPTLSKLGSRRSTGSSSAMAAAAALASAGSSSSQASPASAPQVRQPVKRRQAICEVLSIAGRTGVLSYINGFYDRSDADVCGRPCYRHRQPLGEEFGSSFAGQTVHLFFHGDNDAWALGLDTGSAVVIGYAADSARRTEDILAPWVFPSDEDDQVASEDASVIVSPETSDHASTFNPGSTITPAPFIHRGWGQQDEGLT